MHASLVTGRVRVATAHPVNISGTEIQTLHMHTFSQCQSLETVKLPSCLREIQAEVFIGCKALVNLTLPGGILFEGYRAFGNCAELSPWVTLGTNQRHGDVLQCLRGMCQAARVVVFASRFQLDGSSGM